MRLLDRLRAFSRLWAVRAVAAQSAVMAYVTTNPQLLVQLATYVPGKWRYFASTGAGMIATLMPVVVHAIQQARKDSANGQ